MANISIIGSGFSSLSAACYLSAQGHRVTVFEKNSSVGGRARQLVREGFRFDMGPTFYWMPDIFERFFADFQRTPQQYYTLGRLDPGYRIYFGPDDYFDQPAGPEKLEEAFESLERGSGRRLRNYLDSARFNYRVAIDRVIYRPARTPLELVMPETALRLPQFFGSLSHRIGRSFRDERLRQMLEFPVLFLGAKPEKTPSFYRFMNYADMGLGSWHVEGGMVRVAEGIKAMAESLGVAFRMNAEIRAIQTDRNRVTAVCTRNQTIPTDLVVSGADYVHTESLLPVTQRNFSERYWQRRVFAPSALLFYIGFDRPIDRVGHHTLFFDTSFKAHAGKIYDRPGWPEAPMFYASFPTRTDPSLGPPGKECAVVLIPTAVGLTENDEIKER
ncbi:MAG: phytoene desaturase [Rikenellaceae bacterium]|nr:phytoene desaturase [Rikenellaceae bacterium]